LESDKSVEIGAAYTKGILISDRKRKWEGQFVEIANIIILRNDTYLQKKNTKPWEVVDCAASDGVHPVFLHNSP
jgi:hypothetical protein